jgi:hypothetical protein
VKQREEFKRKTRVCAKEGCGELITQPRVWLCPRHEEAHQDAVERAERRRTGEDK